MFGGRDVSLWFSTFLSLKGSLSYEHLREFFLNPGLARYLNTYLIFKHTFKYISTDLPAFSGISRRYQTHPGICIWLSSPGSRWAPAGYTGGSLGEAGLSQVTEQKSFKGTQRRGEQQTLAEYPSTCKVYSLHRMRVFHTQDTKWVWKANNQLVGIVSPKHMICWTRSFKQLIIILVSHFWPQENENCLLRKGLGCWFLGDCFYLIYLNILNYIIQIFKIFSFILCCLCHPFVKEWAHHNPPQTNISNHGVMMVMEYPSSRGRQVRWPQKIFEGAPLRLAWRSEAISWKLFPISKSHCPWTPELPKPTSQFPFHYCSPTVLFLTLSFLDLSSAPLQPELGLAQLKPLLQGTYLRTPRWS